MINYPPRISLAQTPTPLHPLKRLQESIGGPLIWLKRDDLTGAVLSGNKVRKLEFIAAKAKQQACSALITCGGIQSNHCRATALVAAQLGFKCHLILRGIPSDQQLSDGNQLLDELSGCTISYHKPAEYFTHLDDIFAEVSKGFAERGDKALVIPTGGSDGDGLWGYIAACEELKKDFAQHQINPSVIITASGSGGTQAGLVVGAQLFDLAATVYGINVCDDEDYFVSKIAADIQEWQQKYPEQAKQLNCQPDQSKDLINIIDGYVGKGYGIASDAVIDTIRLLARTEGIVLDPVYSGKAFNGLLMEIANGRFNSSADATPENIVFIHTGGVFGLFAFKEQFAAAKS